MLFKQAYPSPFREMELGKTDHYCIIVSFLELNKEDFGVLLLWMLGSNIAFMR
jgi:hypothetical protein